MAKASDDAVKLGRVAFKRPFDGAYEAADRGAWKLTCRREFEDAGRRLCIENALEWANA